MGPGGRGVAIGGCQQAITARVYLLVQVGDLGHVPGDLEEDDVSSIQADGPVAGVFVKNILDQMNDRRVIMMGPAREPRTHQAGLGCLHVVDDDQSSGRHGQLLGEVLSPVHYLNQCGHFIKSALWHSLEGNFIRNPQDIYL